MISSALTPILVVDDEVQLLTLLEKLLTSQGYAVVGVSSPLKALERLQEQAFDLLLLDLQMPEMDGITLLREALRIDPHIVGVIMTGHGTVQTAVEAMKGGAFDFVLKPFELSSLLQVLARARQVRQLQRENIQLRETVAKYRGIFERAAEGIFQMTPEGRYITTNPALADILGYATPEELLASLAGGAQHLYADPGRWAERLALLREHGSISSFESRVRRRDGTVIWITESAQAVRNRYGAVQYYQGTVEDVSARKQAAEELLKQRAMLYQSEKLATMGQLLAGVAHELNNPLAVLIGQTALLQQQIGAGALAERVEKIVQAAERCAHIVHNFLTLARQRPPERSEVQLNTIVREAVDLLAYQLRVDTIEVQFRLAETLPSLWADPHQLHQVVVNLVSNAHQAMHDLGGEGPRGITLVTGYEHDLQRVYLEVRDTGPGIPDDLAAQIFEPFFTTKPPGVGTGLGLSLCQSTIEEHGGSIQVQSRPGNGAVFRVELPVEESTLIPTSPRHQSARPNPPRQDRTILVVDDEPEVAGVLAELLSMEGYQVEVVTNGTVALDRLREYAYDLILCDIRMPELDGMMLYEEMVRYRPSLGEQIIFTTGDTLSTQVRGFFQQTGVPYFQKPFDFREVRQIVRDMLQEPEA